METVDGLCHVFAVNVLAPCGLTSLVARPTGLVYLSSGLHRGGDPDLSSFQWVARPWNGSPRKGAREHPTTWRWPRRPRPPGWR